MIEIGVATFGDVSASSDAMGRAHAQALRETVEQGCAAEAAGLDFFGVGEHHRPDFAISAPEILLAVIGGRTRTLRLNTAATVLATDDPVRLYQRFATLQATTGGRAEIVLGRGWFAEAFRLFGVELGDYDAAFGEKLDLLVRLFREPEVTWRGKSRPALQAERVYPPLEPGAAPRLWLAVGSTPESLIRSANHDIGVMLAVIGGEVERFRPLADLYRAACDKLGRRSSGLGIHSAGYVAPTDREAREEFWPCYRQYRDQLGRERNWPPLQRSTYDREIESGSLFVGSPATVARKIAAAQRQLGFSRFEMKCSAGPLPHPQILRSIALLGGEVKPAVAEILQRE